MKNIGFDYITLKDAMTSLIVSALSFHRLSITTATNPCMKGPTEVKLAMPFLPIRNPASVLMV
jgi:hypothetical protein